MLEKLCKYEFDPRKQNFLFSKAIISLLDCFNIRNMFFQYRNLLQTVYRFMYICESIFAQSFTLRLGRLPENYSTKTEPMEDKRKFAKRVVHYFKDNRIRNTVIRGIAGYLIIVFIFGTVYYFFDSLSTNINEPGKQLRFFDYLYFSLVTFSTIGYGEIIPTGLTGKIIIAIESCIGLAYTPFFGGYLAYLFIQRPRDFFLTENVFVRHNNNKIYLSARVGNRGKPIVDCDATIAMFLIENNVKKTLIKQAFSRPLVEISWYINLRLDDPENPEPLQHLKTVLANPENCLIRVTFSGQDAASGNLVHLFRYYKVQDIRRGGSFLDVYKWQGVERIIIDWDNFNKTAEISQEQNSDIDQLLNSVL
jgi:inward rectifier potassium channel